MKTLNKAATKTLDILTEGLLPLSDPNAKARKVGKEGGAFMQVVVERLSEHAYSVAHYYEQNGDLMRDPEMVFVKVPSTGEYVPVYFRQDGCFAHEVESVEYEDAPGCPKFNAIRARAQAEQASFANKWMKNLRYQQADYFKGV